MADQSRGALDRFWDDLVQGRPDLPGGLEPTLADAVQRFHAAQDVDGPSPAFVTRLQEDLMLTASTSLPRLLVTSLPVAPNGRVGSHDRVPSLTPPVPARRPGWLASLFFAVVVVLAFGIGYRALTTYEGGSGLGVIPAVVVRDGKPLPNGVTDVESLVEVMVPDGLIAAGARTDLALLLHEVPPGTTRNEGIDPTGCCPGLNVVYVLTGTATVRADGPMQLLPKAGSLEPVVITAGTDVVLAPGDTLLYRQEVTWEWTVSDSGPMEVLLSVALGGIYGSFWNTFSGHPVDSRVEGSLSFPTSEYPIRLWRATLAPEATLQPRDGVVQLAVSPSSASARISDLGGYAVRNLADEPVTLYLMSVGSPDPLTAERTANLAAAPTAIASPATPADVGTLLEVSMPEGIIPAGAPTDLALMLYTVPPGTSTLPDQRQYDVVGLNVFHIVTGSATVRADGPIQVLPMGGGPDPNDVTAGVDVELGAGDTLLYQQGISWTWTVPGTEPMKVLWSEISEGSGFGGVPGDQVGWLAEAAVGQGPVTTLAASYPIRLWQTSLAPGATIQPEPGVVQLVVAADPDTAQLSELADAAVKNRGSEPVNLYVMSLGGADPRTDATPTSSRTLPVDGVTVGKSLVEVTLPADVLAKRDAAEVSMALFTVPAGSTTTWTGADPACCAGQAVMHVLEGTSVFTPGAPASILRAGSGQPVAIAPGVAVDVAPGDTVLAREELPWVWTVDQVAPMRLLASWVLVGIGMSPPEQSAWVNETYEGLSSIVLPAEPLTLRVRRVTLEAGATLPLGSALVQVAIGIPGEDARLSTLSDRSVKNRGSAAADLYVVTLSAAAPGAEVVILGAPPTPISTPSSTPTPDPDPDLDLDLDLVAG